MLIFYLSHYCKFQKPWMKPTLLNSRLPTLEGPNRTCNKIHIHIKLRGQTFTAGGERVVWTALASPYTRECSEVYDTVVTDWAMSEVQFLRQRANNIIVCKNAEMRIVADLNRKFVEGDNLHLHSTAKLMTWPPWWTTATGRQWRGQPCSDLLRDNGVRHPQGCIGRRS